MKTVLCKPKLAFSFLGMKKRIGGTGNCILWNTKTRFCIPRTQKPAIGAKVTIGTMGAIEPIGTIETIGTIRTIRTIGTIGTIGTLGAIGTIETIGTIGAIGMGLYGL